MITIKEDERKVVVMKGTQAPIRTKSAKLEHTTLLLGGSATGFAFKPLAILKLTCDPVFPKEVTDAFDYTGNDSGWMTCDIMSNWINQCFLPQLEKLRQKHGGQRYPALVMMDNHSSRNKINFQELKEMHNVTFLFLPPNASHLLQPMDLSVNPDFKCRLRKKFHLVDDEDAFSRKIRLLLTADNALQWSLNKDCVKTGFRKAGLVPFNESIYDNSNMVLIDHNIINLPQNINKKRKRGARFDQNIITDNPQSNDNEEG